MAVQSRKFVKADNGWCVGRTELREISLPGIKEVNNVLYNVTCQVKRDNFISNTETALLK